jgi:transposase
MSSLPRREYTEEFKKDAVDQVVIAGKRAVDVARSLDIPVGNLNRWLARQRDPKTTLRHKMPVSDLEAQNAQLRRQVAMLAMERDILKKATAYFAKSLV